MLMPVRETVLFSTWFNVDWNTDRTLRHDIQSSAWNSDVLER